MQLEQAWSLLLQKSSSLQLGQYLRMHSSQLGRLSLFSRVLFFGCSRFALGSTLLELLLMVHEKSCHTLSKPVGFTCPLPTLIILRCPLISPFLRVPLYSAAKPFEKGHFWS
jgi:hypothetical protein